MNNNPLVDLTSVKESSGFQPLTEGTYLVQCIEAKVVTTKDGTGEFIKCRFDVVGAVANGRVLFHNFNIKNKSQKAVEIGLEGLKNFLSSATGQVITKLNGVGDMIGLSANAKVVIQNDEKYGPQNRITYFSKFEAAKSSAATPQKMPTNGFPF